MDAALVPVIASLSGAVIGGLITGAISYAIQKQRLKHELELQKERLQTDLELKRLDHKTDFMAEETVMHFLEHKTHIERSFETIEKHVGGFTDDELRKILVRAGAIRSYRADGTEWWRLLSRNDEYIESKKKD